MADGYLHRLLGRASTPAPEISAAEAVLKELVREKSGLSGPASILSELLPILIEQAAPPEIPAISPERMASKLTAGIPLLREEAISLDWTRWHRRWSSICAVMMQHDHQASAKALASAVKEQRLDGRSLVNDVLAGRAEEVRGQLDAFGLDSALGATVLRLTCFPDFCNLCAALAPATNAHYWHQGFCYLCGSWPLLAEYRGLDQIRWLRCGWCASEWQFPRLRCPFCGEADHHQLGYVHLEGEEARYRATTCEQCRFYLKTVSTLSPRSPLQVLISDVATMHLDLAAAGQGYLTA